MVLWNIISWAIGRQTPRPKPIDGLNEDHAQGNFTPSDLDSQSYKRSTDFEDLDEDPFRHLEALEALASYKVAHDRAIPKPCVIFHPEVEANSVENDEAERSECGELLSLPQRDLNERAPREMSPAAINRVISRLSGSQQRIWGLEDWGVEMNDETPPSSPPPSIFSPPNSPHSRNGDSCDESCPSSPAALFPPDTPKDVQEDVSHDESCRSAEHWEQSETSKTSGNNAITTITAVDTGRIYGKLPPWPSCMIERGLVRGEEIDNITVNAHEVTVTHGGLPHQQGKVASKARSPLARVDSKNENDVSDTESVAAFDYFTLEGGFPVCAKIETPSTPFKPSLGPYTPRAPKKVNRYSEHYVSSSEASEDSEYEELYNEEYDERIEKQYEEKREPEEEDDITAAPHVEAPYVEPKGVLDFVTRAPTRAEVSAHIDYASSKYVTKSLVALQRPCLQCVVKGFECDKRFSGCQRCVRRREGDLCLVQRDLMIDEKRHIGILDPVYVALVRKHNDSDEVWARKLALEVKLLDEFQDRLDKKNWVLPVNDKKRKGFEKIRRFESRAYEADKERGTVENPLARNELRLPLDGGF